MIDEARLRSLPPEPGVYMFRDASGEILYIGKAKSLRTRVRSYFRNDPNRGIRLSELRRRAAQVDTVVVGSETEALLLEANLIKEHHPRFNIQLRDDKRYPYIKVTVNEPFPRAWVTRRVRDDGARYFGPFTRVGALRQALDYLQRSHTLRSCRYRLPKEAPPRPCLDYHIGRCQAPCVGLQSQEDYRADVRSVLDILGGETASVRQDLERKMLEAARGQRFEEAARHRDAIRGLEILGGRQRVEQVDGGDQDVVALARDGERGSAVVMRIRRGLLLGQETHLLEGLDEGSEGELLSAFCSAYYLGRGEVGIQELPAEILLPGPFEDQPTLEAVLTERAGRKIRLHVPQRGAKLRLLELAQMNARHLIEDQVAMEGDGARADASLYALQDALALRVVPRLILGYDISHTGGTEVVASVVAFEHGEPASRLYRRMRIRGEWGNDDVRSIGEAVERSLRRRLEAGDPLPDLLMIDGGKGQLQAAVRAVSALGLEGSVALCALAKREEEIFQPGGAESLRLPRRDPGLRLLQRVRDEAHRFARDYNRKLRGKRSLQSLLQEIPGIGPARQQALLRAFGSVEGIRGAREADLAEVPGFSLLLARKVLAYLEEHGGLLDSEAWTAAEAGAGQGGGLEANAGEQAGASPHTAPLPPLPAPASPLPPDPS
jgi:excinuclease ABC subunit C